MLPLTLVVAGSNSPKSAPEVGEDAPAIGRTALLAWGQELYALNCAVCHGRTGGGLSEAKLAFPEDHRNCTRCHRPNNRVVQPLTRPFEDNNMFSIGDPPPLHALPDEGSGEPEGGGLAAVAQPSAILAYVAATMPRYDPGRLTHAQYVAITAHLLVLNDRADDLDSLPPVPDPDL